MLFFGVFLHESAPTAAKNRTNLSSHRRSCRKRLDRSGHTYADSSGNGHWLKKINLSSPKGYLEGVRGHKYKNVERCQTSGPIGTKFGTRMHIHLGMDMT